MLGLYVLIALVVLALLGKLLTEGWVVFDPAAGGDYDRLNYSPKSETAKANPGLYYYSQLYRYRYGIGKLKERTDILAKYLPNAGVGANFSPHHGHLYLGPTHHWISVFREGGLTMPWGEDYIFQVPVGSQQMNLIMVDMFRAGVRGPGSRQPAFLVTAALGPCRFLRFPGVFGLFGSGAAREGNAAHRGLA